jgi:hypothetical protein
VLLVVFELVLVHVHVRSHVNACVCVCVCMCLWVWMCECVWGFCELGCACTDSKPKRSALACMPKRSIGIVIGPVLASGKQLRGLRGEARHVYLAPKTSLPHHLLSLLIRAPRNTIHVSIVFN